MYLLCNDHRPMEESVYMDTPSVYMTIASAAQSMETIQSSCTHWSSMREVDAPIILFIHMASI